MALIEKLFITLRVKKVRNYTGITRVNAEHILKAADGGYTSLEKLVERIRTLQDEEKTIFSELEEVIETLSTPQVKKDKDGIPEKDQQGQPIKIPLNIKEQRAFLRLITIIEDAQTKAELEGVDFEQAGAELQIELPPRLARHLAKRLIKRCSEYFSANTAIVEMHDKFVDLEADAKKVLDKMESDDEVEGDLDEEEKDK